LRVRSLQLLGSGEGVFRQCATLCGEAEEGAHGFKAFFVEGVVDVGGEVGADGLLGEGELAGPLGDEGVNVLEAVVAGLDEVVGDGLVQRAGQDFGLWGGGPDGGDEGESGEGVPLLGEVVVDEVFVGAFEAVGAFFKGEESGVADDDGGVSGSEHGVEVGGPGDKWDVGVAPGVEEDAGVGDGGAGSGVSSDGANGREGLAGAADEEQGADQAAGGDGAAGENAEAGGGGEGGDGDEAEVGGAGGQALSALGGEHPGEVVLFSEGGVEGRVLEVPHERGGIEEADGGDAEAGVRRLAHSS